MTFGELMKKRMQDTNITMRELQRRTGIDIAKISRIANNQILNPSYSNVIKIKNALSISNFEVESCFNPDTSAEPLRGISERFDDNPQLNRLQHVLLESSGQYKIIESLKILTEYLETDSPLTVLSITALQGSTFEINILPFRAPVNEEISTLWQSIFVSLYSASVVFIIDSIVCSSIIDSFDKPVENKLEIDDVVSRMIDCLYKRQISPKDGANYLAILQKYRLVSKDTSNRIINVLNAVNKINIRASVAAVKQINGTGPVVSKREIELLKLEQLIDKLKKNEE